MRGVIVSACIFMGTLSGAQEIKHDIRLFEGDSLLNPAVLYSAEIKEVTLVSDSLNLNEIKLEVILLRKELVRKKAFNNGPIVPIGHFQIREGSRDALLFRINYPEHLKSTLILSFR